ncbi:MAG TPA: hypothetical protein VL330_12135 [Actinomycetes bacterium]|nr:hypothetical protein [Actinomycetota bacterium]HSO53475.1 hypothetical protein [Actinomycetes bacterium]
MVRRRFSLLGLIYILVGIYVAFAENYITLRIVKLVLSALLAIFLWPLVLLGVDLRID